MQGPHQDTLPYDTDIRDTAVFYCVKGQIIKKHCTLFKRQKQSKKTPPKYILVQVENLMTVSLICWEITPERKKTGQWPAFYLHRSWDISLRWSVLVRQSLIRKFLERTHAPSRCLLKTKEQKELVEKPKEWTKNSGYTERQESPAASIGRDTQDGMLDFEWKTLSTAISEYFCH